MMRRKKVDPNAPPPPPRDNGLPPQPADIKDVKAALEATLPGVNVVTGFGYGRQDPQPKRYGDPKPQPAWRLFVFTNDPELAVPTEFKGYPVERRPVPTPFQPRKRQW